jgi:DNA-binding NarL/FixJ family response regulator
VPSKRILIVEDEQVIAEQFRQSLTKEGYEVIGIARSGEEAIAEGQQKRPDLVIMDIVLSGSVDGISAAQHLQPFGVPVVYLTAYSDRHLIDRAQHTQPLGYIIKPTTAGELLPLSSLRCSRAIASVSAGGGTDKAKSQQPNRTSSFDSWFQE